MRIACMREHLRIARWLLLNGGVRDATTFKSMRSEVKVALRTGTSQLLADHFNFTRLVLPAISKLAHASPLAPAQSTGEEAPSYEQCLTILQDLLPPCSRESTRRMASGCCQLQRLEGLESSVVLEIAGFVGVLRDHHLQNAREAFQAMKL